MATSKHASAATQPHRHKHKRLHKGGVLGSGLAGIGALAKIGAGWRLLAGWLGECSDARSALPK
ncbi:hypothetical protein XcvCFBP7111P_14420 [Xanthomonas citri pv. vignicola]|uniref:Uncharacterized protein n=1 Tax=Xanthomonas citri pv. vignicola TaxID=473426 RepID=A0AB33CER8_XANCI|nr:hypothetical protein XcvCFBP7111P_14420 [Xanthomonas citri pv. vignicola]